MAEGGGAVPMNLTLGLLCALAVAVVSSLGVEVWRRVALRHNVLDFPNSRSSHDRPTPRGGGFLIPIAVAATFLLSSESRQTWGTVPIVAVVAAVMMVALVSLWDDFRGVAAPLKLAVHVAAAGVTIAAIGWPSTIWMPGFGVLETSVWGPPLAALWVVGLTNAYNFMDGIDGLAGLQALAAGLGWLVLGWALATPIVGVLGALIAGVSLGFLIHNWPPARIFMGDVGSASLGFAFAVTTLIGGQFDSRLFVIGALLLWPFLFDTSFTFLRRLRRGEPVFSPHRTHLYQRLVIVGFTHGVVTGVYGGLAAVGLGCAWLLATGGTAAGGVSLVAVGASALALCVVVARSERSWRP